MAMEFAWRAWRSMLGLWQHGNIDRMLPLGQRGLDIRGACARLDGIDKNFLLTGRGKV